ncbi:MAG TPA: GNAT family N-acetyltransferase [Ktedonobacterales bacterium]|nr:GNAT family N-acetyltransferase [Ktedonobacterales bacterium]
MAEISYRMATAADAEALAALRWEMESERHEAHVDQSAFLDESRATLREGLTNGTYRAWVAEADGRMISCVVLICWPVMPSMDRLHRSRGMVTNVYTAPEYRRQGIGRRLMEMLIADAQQRHMQRLILWSSEMGRPLYEQLGFVRSRGYELDLPDPSARAPDDADCNLS